MILVRFIRGCWGFYATILTRPVENPDAPRKPNWNDGTDGSQWRP